MSLPAEIYTDFDNWLKEHVCEMLKLPYFKQAQIFQSQNLTNGQRGFKVHYILRSNSSLDDYLKFSAATMRNKLPESFLGKIEYQRHLLTAK